MNPLEALREILALGGPVVAILIVMSVLTLAVTVYKIWQYAACGVGRHRVLSEALAAWDKGDRQMARARLDDSRSYLAPIVGAAMDMPETPSLDDRLDAEAGLALAGLERGFRLLDTIAQLAPLLGLFGTVLGMIEAFQSLQTAGSAVDPSLLAGGIWVALGTTAVGLAVAMRAWMLRGGFESGAARGGVLADRALRTVLVPGQASAMAGTEASSATPEHA